MAEVEEPLRIRRYEQPTSPEEFSSLIEASNVPAVFVGVSRDWKAFSRWNPSSGGLDYLEEQVGSATVEAMLSTSAPVFYGDLRRHERVPLSFSTFLTSCKLYLHHGDSSKKNSAFMALSDPDETQSTLLDSPDKIYLAQVPILLIESKERCPLENLMEDIRMPIFLKAKQMSAINLWMNGARSKSSTHYDPHHNLLCIIAGCKQVVLWPPSASPLLQLMPIYGEASNHSACNIDNPDLVGNATAQSPMEYAQKIILHAGDALFIPEGWFHQVDSNDLTIAVNFWWKSFMMTNMSEHMEAYYLRRILSRLLEREKNKMLCKSPFANLRCKKMAEIATDFPTGGDESNSVVQRGNINGNAEQHGVILEQLEPFTSVVLHELISLVHNTLNSSGQNQVKASHLEALDVNIENDCTHARTENSVLLEDNPITSIFWTIEPLVLQKVFLVMVHYFPRTLEALVLHMLSPTGAEVLTRKFDEMDQQTTKEQQKEFYQKFYSVFDDQHAAMDAILNGKEIFAFQAYKNVLNLHLGVSDLGVNDDAKIS
ncbi:tRNA(Phe) (7-(3-amino-3-carboxypropyl)wyosine(37)-C(2))-hydroxylase protein [Dioscorea alata]|uniref:tRNA(Phe) (7-(3-amino-3-carboxypropyl)wyosine(37)-C(2))-hydroxylase protein n=1 Tax=Dioscorea alata TaxID=55571 RepID=A0ACB7TVT6_DIOAL|nr:tRNA(Phe) (7-(3-amino-3-carboxypropyl)wyosine(37)-C(2))-hydroxylase protein [Dioscorea alata]